MFKTQEQYEEQLISLVKKELALYVRYAVRLREDGGIRHIYNTKIFKEELDNILGDEFAGMDRGAYEAERTKLTGEWRRFHSEAYRSLKSGIMLPFAFLLRKFMLTDFEQYCACLAFAPELNREFERMYCYLQDDYALKYPTLDLCVKMYHADLTVQGEQIRRVYERKELLSCVFQEKAPGLESGLSWRMKLRDTVIDYAFFFAGDLKGTRTDYFLRVPDGAKNGMYNVNPQAEAGIRQSLRPESGGDRKLIILTGARGSGRKTQIELVAGTEGYSVLYFDLCTFRDKSVQARRDSLRDVAARALLDHAYLCFCHWEFLQKDGIWNDILIEEILWSVFAVLPVVFAVTEADCSYDAPRRGYCRVEQYMLRLPTVRQRVRLWQDFLGGDSVLPGMELETLAVQFDFTPGMIREAVDTASRNVSGELTCRAGTEAMSMAPAEGKTGNEESADDETINMPPAENRQVDAKPENADSSLADRWKRELYEACRRQISHSLGERASRVNASYTWDDLVLEKEAKDLLRQAVGQVTSRYHVYEEWGFQTKVAYGRGVTMLFAGPPGTGKTMAAQVIATELDLDLYRVDLSGVLSKYIGETQKNLREIFDEAEKSRSILFFDEADALFGKRVNVTDSRDISANAQTAYLLQKMEDYDGVTILATNLMQNFDDAYKRRM
ncbi:MAG: ATP-binding protein, partial [Lachnospiraceae bacterium]|nr:ATP-binding protein [Lachnospiraceae bacterium]